MFHRDGVGVSTSEERPEGSGEQWEGGGSLLSRNSSLILKSALRNAAYLPRRAHNRELNLPPKRLIFGDWSNSRPFLRKNYICICARLDTLVHSIRDIQPSRERGGVTPTRHRCRAGTTEVKISSSSEFAMESSPCKKCLLGDTTEKRMWYTTLTGLEILKEVEPSSDGCSCSASFQGKRIIVFFVFIKHRRP